MTANLKAMVAAFALVGAAAVPAFAGGDYETREYAGVPVPAPIPVPLYDPVWYFRADVNLGLADAPSASESGMVLGSGNSTYRASDTFGADDSWLENQFESDTTWGIGIGYRWNSWLRMDVTGETKRSQKVRIVGAGESGLVRLDHGFETVVDGTYYGKADDETKLRGGIVMLNAYYDFNKWGAFRPYVGAGLGIGITEIARDNLNREWAVDRSSAPPETHETYNEKTTIRHHETGLAASVMVGTTYQISDITELDFSYRYLWMDAVDSDLVIDGHASTISVDSVHEHNLRAGLRFNVN